MELISQKSQINNISRRRKEPTQIFVLQLISDNVRSVKSSLPMADALSVQQGLDLHYKRWIHQGNVKPVQQRKQSAMEGLILDRSQVFGGRATRHPFSFNAYTSPLALEWFHQPMIQRGLVPQAMKGFFAPLAQLGTLEMVNINVIFALIPLWILSALSSSLLS